MSGRPSDRRERSDSAGNELTFRARARACGNSHESTGRAAPSAKRKAPSRKGVPTRVGDGDGIARRRRGRHPHPERDRRSKHRSSGPGGQSVKTPTPRWLTTNHGLSSRSKTRSRSCRPREALRVLRSRLLQIEEDKRSSESSGRAEQGGGGGHVRGSVPTTSKDRVTDQRINLKLYSSTAYCR